MIPDKALVFWRERATRAQEDVEAGRRLLDWYVPPGDVLSFVEEMERLRERIVTVDLDGAVVRFDRVAECDAALRTVEEAYERLSSERYALAAKAEAGKGLANDVRRHLRRRETAPFVSWDQLEDALARWEAVENG